MTTSVAGNCGSMMKPGKEVDDPLLPRSTEVGHDRLYRRVDEIKPSALNDELYKPVDPDDPQTISLADSIEKYGIIEPIVITLDDVIISGHRRYAAAQLADFPVVPVRIESIRSDDPEFLQLLREYNRQREKSLDERLREEIVSLSSEEAHERLVTHRKAAATVSAETVTLGECRARKGISDAKLPMTTAIKRILEERRQFWPVSDRAIHYALLNIRPLKHASKPDSTYDNTVKSYKSCVDLLTRMRLDGSIPMEAIADETRPVVLWKTHETVGQFVEQELEQFAKNYWRDLMRSQPLHVEILVEKNTVEPIVRSVASRYTIPMTSGRGYCSIPPRHAMAQRFRKSGKERMALIVASDFDPEGESICESFARSMRDDFDVEIVAIKAALTYQQTQELELPPALEAKESSSRFSGFVERYGNEVYELEALDPEKLQELVDEAIRSVINIDLFNREVATEASDAAWLDVKRRRLLAAMAEVN